MKVAILTLHWSNNYGAIYQAYALQRFLKKHGHEPVIINYKMERVGFLGSLKRPSLILRKIVQKRLVSKGNIGSRIKALFSRRHSGYEPNSQIFDGFRKRNLPITERSYLFRDLPKLQNEFDAFIVGSDQVWAADFEFTSSAYLLGFIDRESYEGRLISYAPSFGKARLEPYLQGVFAKHIKKFDSVSCREQSGCKIIEEVACVNAVKVVDPTLLLEDYSEIIRLSNQDRGPFILVYALSQESSLARQFADAILAVKKEMAVDLVVVAPNGCDESLRKFQVEADPEKLLGLIKASQLLMTNSYHGAVFSYLLSSRSLVFPRDKFKDRQNIRLVEFLDLVGWRGRYVSFDSSVSTTELLGRSRQTASQGGFIEKAIIESQTFLLDALTFAKKR